MSKIAKLLLQKGLVTEKQLRKAESAAAKQSLSLPEALIASEAILAEDLLDLYTKHFQYPAVDPLDASIPKKLLSIITRDEAEKWRVIPVGVSVNDGERFVHVAMADPTDEAATEELRTILGPRFKPCVAAAEDIIKAIDLHYEAAEPVPRGEKIGDEIRALTRLVKAMRDLLIEKRLISAQDLEAKLKRSK